MSSSSHEDVFDSDSDTEKPLTGSSSSKGDPHGQVSCEMETKGHKTPSPKHWWPGVSKVQKPLALPRHMSEDSLIQLSPVKKKAVHMTAEDSSLLKQISSNQHKTEQQHDGGQDTAAGVDTNSAVQKPANSLPNGSVSSSLSIANDTDRDYGNVGGQPSVTTQQTVKIPQSDFITSISDKRDGSSGSTTRNESSCSKVNLQQDNMVKEEHTITNSNKESKKMKNQAQIPDTSEQVHMSFQLQHADESSHGTSPTNESRKGQSASAKQHNETPLSNTEFLAAAHQPSGISANNTENLLMKVIKYSNYYSWPVTLSFHIFPSQSITDNLTVSIQH